MNPYLSRLMGAAAPQMPQGYPMARHMMPQGVNPLERAMMIRQAMMNPLAFIKSKFPDIPDQISGDPNQILDYIQRTRGISNQQVQQVYNTYGQQV